MSSSPDDDGIQYISGLMEQGKPGLVFRGNEFQYPRIRFAGRVLASGTIAGLFLDLPNG
jgi:hypothetical protein